MVQNKKDIRIIKTREAIKESLIQLLQEISFNEITVSHITSKAKINRGTFYLHFQDKYDLLEYYENEFLNSIKKIISTISFEELLYFNESTKPNPIFVNIFSTLKENSTFLKAVLGPKGDPLFAYKIKGILKEGIFYKSVDKYFSEKNMLVPKEYFFTYVFSAHIEVVKHWLESGTKESAEEISLILMKLFLLGPFNTLGARI